MTGILTFRKTFISRRISGPPWGCNVVTHVAFERPQRQVARDPLQLCTHHAASISCCRGIDCGIEWVFKTKHRARPPRNGSISEHLTQLFQGVPCVVCFPLSRTGQWSTHPPVLSFFSNAAIRWALAMRWGLSVCFKVEVLNFIRTGLEISKLLL